MSEYIWTGQGGQILSSVCIIALYNNGGDSIQYLIISESRARLIHNSTWAIQMYNNNNNK